MKRSNILSLAISVVVAAACDKAASESTPDAAAQAPVATRVPAAAVDLCSLVTEAEAEAILGKSLAAPQKQRGGDCWYLREGGTDFGDVEFILSIIYAPVQSTSEFDAFVAQQAKEMNDNVKASGVAATPFVAERAEGVGAPAYFIDPGLYVFKGNRILAVGLGGEKGIAIAKTALTRLP